MKVEVNIEKRYFYLILSVIIISAGILIVGAFDPAGLSGTFSGTKESAVVMGHSADEMVVDIGGVKYTLQEAITEGRIGDSTSWSECKGLCVASNSPTCEPGYTLVKSSNVGTNCGGVNTDYGINPKLGGHWLVTSDPVGPDCTPGGCTACGGASFPYTNDVGDVVYYRYETLYYNGIEQCSVQCYDGRAINMVHCPSGDPSSLVICCR